MGIQTTTTLKHTTSTTNQHNNFQSLIMESIKQGANYVAETVQGAVSGASKEANKEVAKDSNAPVGTRMSAAKDALGDKADESATMPRPTPTRRLPRTKQTDIRCSSDGVGTFWQMGYAYEIT